MLNPRMSNKRILSLALILGSTLFPAACLSRESTAEVENERAAKIIERIHKDCVKEVTRASRRKMKESTMQALAGAHSRSALGLVPQQDLTVQAICQDAPKVTDTAELPSDKPLVAGTAAPAGGHN